MALSHVIHLKTQYESLAATGAQIPSQKYVDEQGLEHGYWLSNQKAENRLGELEPEHARLLKKPGVELDNAEEKSWQTGYQYIIVFYRGNKSACVPVAYNKGTDLPWVNGFEHRLKMKPPEY